MKKRQFDCIICAFTLDGHLVLSASWDETLLLWDVASRREVVRFIADAPLNWCGFSSQGRQVVTGDQGYMVHLLTVMGLRDEPASLDMLSALQSAPTLTPSTLPEKPGRRRLWWRFLRLNGFAARSIKPW
jgi:hypothetical protein